MKFETTKKHISTSILISMTDVVFLLIIFLLISSSFITQSGIPIKLPASTAQAQQNPKTISVTLTQDGSVYVENRLTPWDQLSTSLSQLKTDDNLQVVYLRADEVTELKNVVKVMDIIKQSGYERIYIATQQARQIKQ
ncbi:MAG TPA: biopolymer transporter ExbD [Candidatus Cloacimonadota bacterium]|nr:biopolymer transporter ExbD [Candidatus Cloacimonadota bacterium]HPT71704.1 biopolymer transporter ExbD [Candidatus Cloacimonadota bacterium]